MKNGNPSLLPTSQKSKLFDFFLINTEHRWIQYGSVRFHYIFVRVSINRFCHLNQNPVNQNLRINQYSSIFKPLSVHFFFLRSLEHLWHHQWWCLASAKSTRPSTFVSELSAFPAVTPTAATIVGFAIVLAACGTVAPNAVWRTSFHGLWFDYLPFILIVADFLHTSSSSVQGVAVCKRGARKAPITINPSWGAAKTKGKKKQETHFTFLWNIQKKFSRFG